MTNNDLMNTHTNELLGMIPMQKLTMFREFIHEMNNREHEVRFKKSCTFDTYKHKDQDVEKFGFGFIVNNKSVPYFHPNRSFHDEIVWLNNNVFYNNQCSFEDMLINAAIVKFYGPSNTIKLICKDTGYSFVKYDLLVNDDEYLLKCMQNIEDAKRTKEKIYGTTELRTSLQTESRNYTRIRETPYDKSHNLKLDLNRKSRVSDMLYWFTYLGPKFVEFYKKKPTMSESFYFLTKNRGIGNYYGYHFSTNLARMPEIGTEALLKSKTNKFGKLDEDDDFVAPGVGAMITINWFYEDLKLSINTDVGAKIIRSIKKNQNDFFDFKGEKQKILSTITETGSFTTFGVEISCCQFSVFLRLKDNKDLALRRAMAPISKEGLCETNKTSKQISLF